MAGIEGCCRRWEALELHRHRAIYRCLEGAGWLWVWLGDALRFWDGGDRQEVHAAKKANEYELIYNCANFE